MPLLKISAKEANTSHESSHDISENNAINEFYSDCGTDNQNNETQTRINDIQELQDNEVSTFAMRMLNLCREFAIFCLIMATYAALTKDPPKITRAPAAYPFFPSNSIIKDWYRGQISKAIEHARISDVAFVMFYAPWDAESQAARKEFEITAKYMQDYVTFTAVNCWQPNSECRSQYSKVFRWPVLIAYPSHGRGIQYNGPISAPHMIHFLQKVCSPILRKQKENLTEFEDVYVMANINASPGSIDFAVFYTTALKYLEKDPLQRISFYVDPQPTSEPTLYLHLWNETLMYPVFDREWLPDEILLWIIKNTHQITTWISPSGTKSFLLSTNLQSGPTLILFTPKNPFRVSTDYYNTLQEISHEYHNCDNNLMVNLNIVNLMLKRSDDLLQYKKFKKLCKINQDISRRKIISHLNSVWPNTSNCVAKSEGCDLIENKINYFYSEPLTEDCIKFDPVVPTHCKSKCVSSKFTYTAKTYKTSMLAGENDHRSPENLKKLWQKEKCKQFISAEKLYPAIFENRNYNENEDYNISGLACKNNKSIIFMAMDSLVHYHFAEKLGIDLSEYSHRSAIVIVNEKMESHYIMKGSINSLTIREYIKNFTKNQLPRSLDSYATLNLPRTQNIMFKSKIRDKSKVIIAELDTSTFLPTVLQKNKAVIVFYYSKQCSFCSGISYTILTIAKKLSFVENLLFARIDGDVNILPWEYTMEVYPTVLFIPANKKSESRVFPLDIPITTSNLLGFILTNIDHNLKLQAMWSVCCQITFQMEKSTCYSSLQAETLTLIDNILHQWRKSNKRQKQVLLHKLKQLRQLHLLFGYYPQKHRLIQNYFKKLNLDLNHSEDYHNLNNK